MTTATFADTRKRPAAGIGFGQKGYWGNKHFSSIESAEAAYEKYLAETRVLFAKDGRGGIRPFREEAIPPNGDLIRGVRFVPLKKNGKPGVLIHTVHLYRMRPEIADRFMADRFYSVSE